jgi:hypothetical protein
MNPIPSKQQAIGTLPIDDKKRSRNSLTADCQFHIQNSFGFRWIATKVFENHVSLDEIIYIPA